MVNRYVRWVRNYFVESFVHYFTEGIVTFDIYATCTLFIPRYTWLKTSWCDHKFLEEVSNCSIACQKLRALLNKQEKMFSSFYQYYFLS